MGAVTVNGLPYYKAYPRDFIEGTIGMPFEVRCAYRVVLDLIYMQGGNLPDDARYISGLLGCSVRKWTAIRSALIEADKVQVSGAFLTNYRAVSELETLAKHQDKQRENGRKPKKSKGLSEPRLNHTEPDIDTEANASDADASSEPDFREEVWARGVRFLQARGVSERNARTVIGKWLRDHEAASVFSAFDAASRERPVEPVAWITARLGSPPKPAVDMDAIWKSLETGTHQ